MSDKKAQDKNQGVDTQLVKELAAILRDTGLTEIEVEHGALRLRLARGGTVTTVSQAAPTQHAHHVAEAAIPTPAPALAAVPSVADHPGAVKSPMVGTAYLSPEPGAAVFVKVGDTVTEGQTLLVVEAMKTFNPIPAPRAGKVTQIIIGDAQPVEFGEPLMILE